MTDTILYKETQRFTQWYIWILLLGMLLIPVYGIIQQLVFKEPFGDKPMSDLGLVIFFFGMLTFCVLFLIMQLKTIVTKEKITAHFVPFFSKTFTREEVAHAEIVTYGFVGYGIRFSKTYGTVYNIKGNKGIALTLTNKKKFLIGTQKPHELDDVIQSVLK
jgi:uncharacterized membrane protein